MKGLRLALGTLTIIPVGDLGEIERRDARAAMLLAPVAALPLGLVITVLLGLGHLLNAPALVSGFVVVAALAYGTRAMHLDGLADTVDGFGAGWTRERALEVMKSGDIGPMGVVALVVALGVQAACLGALSAHPFCAGMAVLVARLGCTGMASTRWKPARPDGLGAVMASVVPVPALLVTAAGWSALFLGISWLDGVSPLRVLFGLACAVCGLEWLARRATRIIGGVSGDIFGAAIEIALTLLLVPLVCGGIS